MRRLALQDSFANVRSQIMRAWRKNLSCAGLPARTRVRGFTLLELITTIAIIALMAVLLLPALQNAYRKARRAGCASQMKQIGTAFHIWAQDHNDLYPFQVPENRGGTLELAQQTAANPNLAFTYRHFQAVSNELLLPKILLCPSEKMRQPARDFATLQNENISYWLNLSAAHGSSLSPLAGDRNVRTSGRMEWTFLQFSGNDAVEFSAELHGYRGNVVFGDSHVDNLDAKQLRLAFSSISNGAEVTLTLPAREWIPEPGSTVISSGPSTSIESGSVNASSGQPVANVPATGNAATHGTAMTSARSPGRADAPAAPSATAPKTSGDRTAPGHLQSQGDVTVFTRLDGTFVTSAVPRHFTNAATASWRAPTNEAPPPNRLLEGVQSLARKAERHTRWLLWLLLLLVVLNQLDRIRRKLRRRSAR